MPSELIRGITSTIDGAVSLFEDAIPFAEQGIAAELEQLLRSLKVKNGKLVMSVENLRTLSRINGQLESVIVRNPKYQAGLEKYLSTFERVQELQVAYFQKLSKTFSPSKFLVELQKDSLQATRASLLRGGISQNVVGPITDILRESVRVGINYNTMVSNLKEVILGTPTIESRLTQYAKQISTDALNQYSAGFMEVAAADLGLEWFDYAGAEMITSRLFCQAMVHKRFYHVSEIPSLLSGDFKEFKEVKGKINSKTGLPDGMVYSTTPATFNIYRGGYNCRHQAIPVPESAVPSKVRILVYAKQGIAYDFEGYKIAE